MQMTASSDPLRLCRMFVLRTGGTWTVPAFLLLLCLELGAGIVLSQTGISVPVSRPPDLLSATLFTGLAATARTVLRLPGIMLTASVLAIAAAVMTTDKNRQPVLRFCETARLLPAPVWPLLLWPFSPSGLLLLLASLPCLLFPLLTALLRSRDQVPGSLKIVARAYSFSRWQTVRSLILPVILPPFLNSLLASLPAAVTVLLWSECLEIFSEHPLLPGLGAWIVAAVMQHVIMPSALIIGIFAVLLVAFHHMMRTLLLSRFRHFSLPAPEKRRDPASPRALPFTLALMAVMSLELLFLAFRVPAALPLPFLLELSLKSVVHVALPVLLTSGLAIGVALISTHQKAPGDTTSFIPWILFFPFVMSLQTAPALTPLLFFLILCAAIFLPLHGSLRLGITHYPPVLRTTAEAYGIRGFLLWRKILLPAAGPSWLAGARQAAAIAWMLVFAAEWQPAGQSTDHSSGIAGYLTAAVLSGHLLSAGVALAFLTLFAGGTDLCLRALSSKKPLSSDAMRQ